MTGHPALEVRLRPAWHVSLPFLLGAFMLGIIAIAARQCWY